MRITFQNTDTNQNIERQRAAQRESSASGTGMGVEESCGYMLDLSGSSGNHTIYQEQERR